MYRNSKTIPDLQSEKLFEIVNHFNKDESSYQLFQIYLQAITALRSIVALIALALERDRIRCLAAGANDYLTKSVKLKQLNTTIQQFLDAKI